MGETDQVIETPEPPHVHASHGSSGILDKALAVAVILISVASLLVARHTSHTMEALVAENARLVRASSTPVLQWDTGNVGENGRELNFEVANVGSGPARVVWFEVRLDGKPYANAQKLMLALAPAGDLQWTTTTTSVANRFLPPNKAVTIFRWVYPEQGNSVSQATWTALDRRRFDLEIEACFCSVLDECWTSNLGADVPRPVKACDAKGRTNFMG